MAAKPTGKQVKFTAVLKRITFPSSGLGTTSTYGVTKWQLVEPNPDVVTSGYDIPLATVVGDFFEPINKRTHYIISADEIKDPKYGIQYKIRYLSQQVNLDEPEDQMAFLGGCGITQNQIQAIYDTLEDPFEIIKNKDVVSLMRVKGIGEFTANRIISLYTKNQGNEEVFAKLTPLGFTSKFIKKLLDTYGSPNRAIEIIETNPYDLIYTMERIGFLTADKIALKLQLDPKSKDRIAAFIYYYLDNQAEERGNSYVYVPELNRAIYDALGEDIKVETETGNNIKDAIDYLISEEKIILEHSENLSLRRVYLKRIYDLEKEIAQHLIRLKDSSNFFNYDDWQIQVALLEDKQGFKFSQEQKDGIKLGLDNQVCVISGLAGSGKSALVAGILAALRGYTVAQCALSGKAAARLQEVTGRPGTTIHKLIMAGMNGEDFIYRDQQNPLDYNIIILDEISMVSGDIFVRLLRAIPTGSKLIMLGDPGQLEAIGPLNIANDMIESSHIPSVELKTVHRQALDSGILASAYSVRNQIPLFFDDFYGTLAFGNDKDMLFNMLDRDLIRNQVMDYFKKAFTSETVKQDINNIMLISPVRNRGDSCVFSLNQDVQDYYNPVSPTELNSKLLRIGTEEKGDLVIIHAGDKVMCTKNNYKTVSASNSDKLIPIYNGWTGTVLSVDVMNITIKFSLAEEPVVLPKDLARDIITLGYCSTCHKLQGSDAPFIIGVVDYSTPPSMLTNSLLYTLITRAKKRCVIVGETGAFNLAVSQEFVSTKRTFLQELLEKIDIPY